MHYRNGREAKNGDKIIDEFARAVFRSIAFGHTEMPTKAWPSFRCWVPAPRTYLPDCMAPAERTKPLVVRHGPIVRGNIQPIRKRFDPITRRIVTNEV